MKTAIIESESFTDYQVLKWHLEDLAISEVVTSQVNDINDLIKQYAREKNLPLSVVGNSPQSGSFWLCRQLFLIVQNCETIVLFWNGNDTAIDGMIQKAREKGKEVIVVRSFLPGKFWAN